MSKTVIGIVTFGNLNFTKLAVESVFETINTSNTYLCIIVGKPGDTETAQFASELNIPHYVHDMNYGFPYSVNDLYDHAFIKLEADNLIVMGNDVIAYPHTIDNMILTADSLDYDWVCPRQIDVKSLCMYYPEVKQHFSGSKYKYNFTGAPWKAFSDNHANSTNIIPNAGFNETHNLGLFKRSVYDKVGYIDVNFYPAYFEDNDLVTRAIKTDLKSCVLSDSWYFHFWSRTIHQGSGGSNGKFFDLNKKFYKDKWGGLPRQETFSIPFNGADYSVNGILQPTDLKLGSRDNEVSLINYWRSRV